MAEQHRFSCGYKSDDGNTYRVVLGEHKLALGGFGSVSGAAARLPTGIVMRQIHGRTANNQRSYSFPWSDPADVAWKNIGGQTFTYDGETFIITGASGERRTLGPASV